MRVKDVTVDDVSDYTEPDPTPQYVSSLECETQLLKTSVDLGKYEKDLSALAKKIDELRRADPTFWSKHRRLMGHLRRLHELMDESRKAMHAINTAWKSKSE